MKIAVVCANGKEGQLITKEAINRGFDVTAVVRGENGRKSCGGFETINEGIRYPKNLIKFNRDREKLHPTQKPIKLLEYLICTYSNPNDVVLDNCMGSGSTAVAAINTNRQFIGFEKDEKYFNIANDRIENLMIWKK